MTGKAGKNTIWCKFTGPPNQKWVKMVVQMAKMGLEQPHFTQPIGQFPQIAQNGAEYGSK